MTLKFITWDVEHGSAAYIRTPNGSHIVIDLGARRSADINFSPLLHLQHQWGVGVLDLVIITHPHLDHIEDILHFDSLSPRALISPNHLTKEEIWAGNENAAPEIKKIFGKYIDVSRRYNQSVSSAENPTLESNNGDVSFQFFRPTQSSTQNFNNHSVVTVMTYAGVKFLLPGDNESTSWQELLSDPNFIHAINNTHVFVASHHGRLSGYHRPLFDHFSPLLTIISDGRVVGTSVTEKYNEHSRGWNVRKRSGGREKRYCITTRSDGVIDIEVVPSLTGVGTLLVTIA